MAVIDQNWAPPDRPASKRRNFNLVASQQRRLTWIKPGLAKRGKGNRAGRKPPAPGFNRFIGSMHVNTHSSLRICLKFKNTRVEYFIEVGSHVGG
jgi:hypothetical protein